MFIVYCVSLGSTVKLLNRNRTEHGKCKGSVKMIAKEITF